MSHIFITFTTSSSLISLKWEKCKSVNYSPRLHDVALNKNTTIEHGITTPMQGLKKHGKLEYYHITTPASFYTTMLSIIEWKSSLKLYQLRILQSLFSRTLYLRDAFLETLLHIAAKFHHIFRTYSGTGKTRNLQQQSNWIYNLNLLQIGKSLNLWCGRRIF